MLSNTRDKWLYSSEKQILIAVMKSLIHGMHASSTMTQEWLKYIPIISTAAIVSYASLVGLPFCILHIISTESTY